jgi:hypothetical protein
MHASTRRKLHAFAESTSVYYLAHYAHTTCEEKPLQPCMHTHFKQSKPQQGGRNDRLMPIHDCLKNLKWGRRICMVMALASSLFLMRRSAVKRHAARHAGAGREIGEEAHASQGRVQAQGRVED